MGQQTSSKKIKDHLISTGTEDSEAEKDTGGHQNGQIMGKDREFGQQEHKGNTMTWWLPTYGLKATDCNVALTQEMKIF